MGAAQLRRPSSELPLQILTKRYHKERGIYAPITSLILTINYRFENKSASHSEHFRRSPFLSSLLFLSRLSQFPHYLFPSRLLLQSHFAFLTHFRPSVRPSSVDPAEFGDSRNAQSTNGRDGGGMGEREIGDCRTSSPLPPPLLYPDFFARVKSP